ncbi:MAG: ATP-dependent zinc metalloprotease FtsH [Clostridiales bacterium]|nr:ATP-dependent zinc metalloprotease FtsH [Clostridiales bacterium]
MKHKRLFIVVSTGLLLIISGLLGYKLFYRASKDLSYKEFISAVDKGQVQEVILEENSNSFVTVLREDIKQKYTVPHPKTDDFTQYLLLNDVKVSYGNGTAISTLLNIAIVAAVIFAVVWYSRNSNTQASLISDANTKKSNKDEPVTLAHVAGNAEAKSMVEDIIDFIRDPDKYASVGARMPKGLLFYGPPGTGKTLMAKAIAGEAGVPFYAMSGSDFVQMYVGVGASRVRSLFAKAKKSRKAVIFIDEIDAIGKKRARSASASNDERDQTLNALLSEMSGFHDNQGIIVIGATNRLDTLDEALLRPGRFDRHIEIGLPDVNARRQILALHAKNKPLADSVDLDGLARSTVYFSGAMLENLLNEAAINAANDKSKYIKPEHIDKAFYTVIAGAQKMDRSYISELDRKITAYHEAGHALATQLLLPDYFISKVTIIPSVKGAGGFNLTIPKDEMFTTERQLKANIQVLLAGRAAEEIIFGSDEVTTGAGNDIQKASRLMVDYINKFGMDNELGLFSTEVLADSPDNELIAKCRGRMKELYDDTVRLIKDNLPSLEAITDELLEKESLSGDDIIRLCS